MAEEYKCKVEGCNRSFQTANGVQAHQRAHKEKQPRQCLICSQIFSSEPGFLVHMTSMHGGWSYGPRN